MRRISILLLAFMLAGCGTSPRTHYYTLAPATAPDHDKVRLSSPITVSAVDLPPSLDRSSMVHRTGENTVAINGEDQWAAPLGEMTRRVLSQDLADDVPKDKLVLPGAPAPPGTRRIVVSIVQFGTTPDGRVVLTGSWSMINGGGDTPAFSHAVALATPAPAAGSEGEAAGMSRLLRQLASQIAETLAQRT